MNQVDLIKAAVQTDSILVDMATELSKRKKRKFEDVLALLLQVHRLGQLDQQIGVPTLPDARSSHEVQ